MTDSSEMIAGSTIESDLLPPNATTLEKKLSRLASALSRLPIDTEKLWDAEQCSEVFLPWLAWAMSVDYWQSEWNENVKRTLIKQSVAMHQQRGTRAAVKEAVRLVLALADNKNRNDITNIAEYENSFLIREWWEPRVENIAELESNLSPTKIRSVDLKKQPLTFEIQLLIGRGVLGGRGLLRPELYRDLRRAVDAVKPMSTRYTLSIGGAKLETELPLRTTVRTIQTVSFTVKPKIALKFDMQLSLAPVIRASEARFLKLLAKPKLQLESSLPLRNGLRAVTIKTLAFQLPILKLKYEKNIQATIRTPILIRLAKKLDGDS